MTLRVEDVANYIIELANSQNDEDFNFSEGITQLKLQKLLYFTQATFLSCLGKKAFDDPIYAFKYGPVVKSILDKYTGMGSKSLDVDKGWNNNVISKEDKQAIKRVWEIFGGYSSSRLVDMTHSHQPRIETKPMEEINVDSISEFYKDRIAF